MSNSAFTPAVLTIPATGTTGSGQGELNVITNPSAATDLSSWTASGLTASRLTSGSPLDPVVTTAFNLNAAASSQTFTSSALTVPSTLRNTKLKVEFYYEYVSGSSFTVDVLDGSTNPYALSTDNSSGATILAQRTGKFVAYFDANNTSTLQVRLTSGGAGVMKFTQVIVGPGIQPQGAVVGASTLYNAPIGAVTTAPTPGTNTIVASYVRMGDMMKLNYSFRQTTTGTAGSGIYLFPLPSGLTIDSTRLGSLAIEGQSVLGAAEINNGTTTLIGVVLPYNSSNLMIQVGNDTTAPSFISSTFYQVSTNTNLRYSFEATIPIAEWAGSGTVQLAQNDVEYAASAAGGSEAGWDAPAAVGDTVYGPNGAVISGALTAQRVKRVRFQTPSQAGDKLFVEIQRNGQWVDLAQIFPHMRQNVAEAGATILPVSGSSTDFDVYFYQYSELSGATFGAAGASWPSSTRWRVRKSSAGAAVGFGIVQPGVSSGLVSASGLPGNTSGNTVATGYVGEKVFANTVNNSSGLSSTSNFNNIQSITLNKGLWLVTSIIDADNAATCTGHFNAISVNAGNTTTDHIRGVNQVTTSIPANSSAATCIANYHMTITADATFVYQKGKAIGAATTCSASIQAIRIA